MRGGSGTGPTTTWLNPSPRELVVRVNRILKRGRTTQAPLSLLRFEGLDEDLRLMDKLADELLEGERLGTRHAPFSMDTA